MSVKAIFPPGVDEIIVHGLHQWDYGQQLQIEAADLPALVEVHFACASMGEAVVRSCSVNTGTGVATVTIPDNCLEQSAPITAWVYQIGETSGTTIKIIKMIVTPRPRPATSEDVPVVISDKYTAAVTAMNDLVAEVRDGKLVLGNAARAAKADEATRAAEATHAAKADEATHAGEATYAAKADEAAHAAKADKATSSTSATCASVADRATTASNLLVENIISPADDQFVPVPYSGYITTGKYFANSTFQAYDEPGMNYICLPCKEGEVYKVDMNGCGWNCFYTGEDSTVLTIIIGTEDSDRTTAEKIFTINYDGWLYINYTSANGSPLIYIDYAKVDSFRIDKPGCYIVDLKITYFQYWSDSKTSEARTVFVTSIINIINPANDLVFGTRTELPADGHGETHNLYIKCEKGYLKPVNSNATRTVEIAKVVCLANYSVSVG